MLQNYAGFGIWQGLCILRSAVAFGDLLNRNQEKRKKMKKVISTLTAAAFVLGLAGAAMAQSVTKDAAKPAAKTEVKVTQTQAAPKAEKPGDVAKPAAKEEVKPGEKAKTVTPGAKETPKAGEKEKGKDPLKKSTMPEKKGEKKADCPTDKPVKK